MYENVINGVKKVSCVVKMKFLDENYIWNKVILIIIFDEDGNFVRVIGI